MSLDIFINDKCVCQWYLSWGNHAPDLRKELGVWNTVWVTASGDELGAVTHTFAHLPCLQDNPIRPGFSMTWWGDHARFIVSNLHLVAGRHQPPSKENQLLNDIEADTEPAWEHRYSFNCAACGEKTHAHQMFRNEREKEAFVQKLANGWQPVCGECRVRSRSGVTA